MTQPSSITDTERKLVIALWMPYIPRGDMSPHVTQQLTDAMWEGSAPFASYALNRVAAWLEGDAAFKGDDIFDVAWSDLEVSTPVFSKKGRTQAKPRVCTLSRKEDGATWTVTFASAKYRDVPEITLSRIGSDGREFGIARGEITTGEPGSGNRHGFSNCPPPVKGTVEGDIEYGAFDDLCDFCTAIRGSLPDRHLDVPPEQAVTFAHLERLENMMPILDLDDGLPGRVCSHRHLMIATVANKLAGRWMRGQYAPLIDGLRERGAEWGKAVISYNDSDYRCCLVDFSDGSIGLFSDNTASCADEHAYVARLEMDGDTVKSVSVHLLRDSDYDGMVAAIGEGSAQPDYVHDYDRGATSFPGGRDGWAAMTMFLWQSMADSTYALKDGRLDEGCRYWQVDAASVPAARG